MKTALSIAGNDPSGGAGAVADIRTMTANGVYAMSVLTALTVQNTTGVFGVLPVTPDFLRRQLDAVFEDIRPDAVKVGMAASGGLIHAIAERLRAHRAANVVVDPVMIATSGDRLLECGAIEALTRELLHLAALATPNIPEAEALSGLTIRSHEDMGAAAERISSACGCPVLVKGGHLGTKQRTCPPGDEVRPKVSHETHSRGFDFADDLLYHNGTFRWFPGRRIDNPNTHGTGCTLSSAIAANLAKDFPLEVAVARAKEYLSGALEAMLDLGQGSGPVDHLFDLRSRWLCGPEEKTGGQVRRFVRGQARCSVRGDNPQ